MKWLGLLVLCLACFFGVETPKKDSLDSHHKRSAREDADLIDRLMNMRFDASEILTDLDGGWIHLGRRDPFHRNTFNKFPGLRHCNWRTADAPKGGKR